MQLTPKIHFYNKSWIHIKNEEENFYYLGWIDYKGNILSAQSLLKQIRRHDIEKEDVLQMFLSKLNGNFSLIYSNASKTIIAADKMRMYPIIYFRRKGQLIITDNIEKYTKVTKSTFLFDSIVLEQYFYSDYVFGPYTIFKDVFSIQAGELINIWHSKGTITQKQYFQWLPNMRMSSFDRDIEEEAKKQELIFRSIFSRMLKSAPNINNWIIPLSGGYDSRVIVNYLHKLGVKNVICFSYGIENNIQSEISKNVSEALGYKWIFINYEYWNKVIHETNLIKDYLFYAFNGSSVAHLQDFTAVYALEQMGIIKENDVFVPGHALEVLAGNHLVTEMKECSNLSDSLQLIRWHFSGFGYAERKRVGTLKHVRKIVEEYKIHPTQVAEYFDWQERQTKYIANSVKVYEYFGYSWRIPEWDSELFMYWKKIEFNHRIGRNMFKKLFKEYLSEYVIKEIPFANDIYSITEKPFQTQISRYLPFFIKRLLKRLFIKQTNYFTNEGSHLIYSNINDTLFDFINSNHLPCEIKSQLEKYPKKQKLSSLPVNNISTLLNIKKAVKMTK